MQVIYHQEQDSFENSLLNLNSLKTDSNLIGREIEAEEILYRIISSSMLLIEGKEGVVLKKRMIDLESEGK